MKRRKRARRARLRKPEYRGKFKIGRMLDPVHGDQDMIAWYERYTGKVCSISAA